MNKRTLFRIMTLATTILTGCPLSGGSIDYSKMYLNTDTYISGIGPAKVEVLVFDKNDSLIKMKDPSIYDSSWAIFTVHIVPSTYKLAVIYEVNSKRDTLLVEDVLTRETYITEVHIEFGVTSQDLPPSTTKVPMKNLSDTAYVRIGFSSMLSI